MENLGTDHPFHQLMKLAGGSILRLLNFSPEHAAQYHFEATVLKEKRYEPDMQGIPLFESELSKLFIEFQGYRDVFIRCRAVAQSLQSTYSEKSDKPVYIAIIYTDKEYQQAARPLNQVIPNADIPIHEIVLTDYSLEQLLEIDPKLVVLAPFTESKHPEKTRLLQQVQQWTTTVKQVYASDKQADALNVLTLLLLDRFRDISREEIINMMQFDLMQTRAGQDIFLIGKNEGIQEGIQKGIQQGEQKGKLEGKLEEKQEIALSMLSRGLSVELIMDVTQLSEQDILALQAQLPPTVH